MTHRLDVDDIDVAYGASVVLREVSLHASAGEVVVVLGRNGAGKTTLVRAIVGLTPPRTGRIAIDGTDVTGDPPPTIAARGVGYVPQGRRLFPEMTVRENLEMGAGRGPVDEDRLATVYELFPRIRDRIDQRAGTLSGGEQQMVAIARALIRDPRLTLLDEPTEGLMPSLVAEIAGRIDEIADAGRTILLVSQRVDLALDLADRVYVLAGGRIEHEGRPADLRDDPAPIERHVGVGLRE